ncbi:hypothetical protein [Cohnella mopanensis]|uniref:hypothetical protein n=1 Tax=Cohnella mopanensis TaxID=2911966 RepID=UPI001EF7C2F1|nr:hypothetical protein [Cohnella mopanensis]
MGITKPIIALTILLMTGLSTDMNNINSFISNDNFYEVAKRGAWHEVDNHEKSRYKDGKTIPIYHQITTAPNLLYVKIPLENTYVTDDMGMAAMEIDPLGNVVWERKAEEQTYFGIAPLNKDELLLSLLSYNRLIKINKKTGEETLILNEGVRDVQVTSDGDILTVENSETSKVILLSQNGTVIWESKPTFYYPRGVWRKTDGNILVVDFNHKAYEIDYKSKKIIWEMGGFNHPNSIQEMKNSNYLIADEHNNRVIEINPSMKKIVRKYDKGLWSPNSARELPNGDWLISDSDNHRVIQINRMFNIVWELSNLNNPNRAVRYDLRVQ